jgi:uncharacterized membrane protein
MTQVMSGGLGAALLVLTSLVSVVTTVFWLFVGWRAMRAHEEIARVLRERGPR